METLTKLFSQGLPAKFTDKKRLWLKPGEPALINGSVYLTTYFDRYDETYTPILIAKSKAGEASIEVPQESYHYFSLKAGMIILPVAMLCDASGKPCRMMIDIAFPDSVGFDHKHGLGSK